MDLRQLESFVAVHDTGGFSRAAEALGITQPAVSAHVVRLERELGTALFDRGGPRGARATAAALAALPAARAALAGPDTVRAAVAAHAGLLVGRLRLGHVASGAAGTLLEPLTAFRSAHPGVEVSLVELPSDRLVADVLADRLDLAWVATAARLPRALATDVVQDEPVVLAVPDTPAWRAADAIVLADLADLDVVAMPRGTGAREALDRVCEEAGVVPRISWECSSPARVAGLVERGLGVAVLTRPLARHLGLRALPLGDARSRLVRVRRRDVAPSPAAAALLAEIGHPRDPAAGPVGDEPPA